MLKFLITAILIYLAFTLFRKKQVESKKGEIEESVDLEKDEICGIYIEKTTPYKVKYYDKIYYFCSKDCMDKFIAKVKEKRGES
ncbi:YHS domain-containing protein [Deferribacter autotrophicus]|uniref:YHS domain-containing protein n=1 Tax=Deferribacter autotrophicus TaxID=500465 RepID=A0A5A8F8N2_9BACT|nr:YHS domain-containing protein [Deferribacter autotrophicus]KAA0259011.1 YHS domain-containing protein [Deferribacter autotrophicus]